MIESLGKVTLCIFTADRHHQLLNVIKYYSKFDLKIVILDASLKAAEFRPSEKINYVHVPGMLLQNRLIKFAEMVKTEYILLSPDDDFYSIYGLAKTINFLEKNRNYSSAQGLRIRFFDSDKFSWIPDYVKQSTLHFNQEDFETRILNMGKSMHYIYSVMRLSVYSEVTDCLRNIESQDRNSFAINELIFNYCLPVFGDHRILPFLYQLRKSHPYLGSDIDFALWINNNQDKQASLFKSKIKELYVKKLGISNNEADAILSKFNEHFSLKKTIPMKAKTECKARRITKKMFNQIGLFNTARQLRFKYFVFYSLLVISGNLLNAIQDIKYLRNTLKKQTFL
jgi:glycosyltransferase domain-containing protein